MPENLFTITLLDEIFPKIITIGPTMNVIMVIIIATALNNISKSFAANTMCRMNNELNIKKYSRLPRKNCLEKNFPHKLSTLQLLKIFDIKYIGINNKIF